MTDMKSDIGGGLMDLWTGIRQALFQTNKELITVLRQPTPIKITKTLTADGNGVIGGGILTPASAIDIFQCPSSHEAWINRISITSPTGTPKTPLITGQVVCFGSTAGEPIFWLPVAGTTLQTTVAPVYLTEGRLSAAHLNGGERMLMSADSLPPGTVLRFDLQITLVTGVSVDTPRVVGHSRNVLD